MRETARLTIHLDRLANNYRLLQSKVKAGCAVAGVVKANAYGLGLGPVVTTLASLHCPQFFVATLEEAIALRKMNSDTPVAVLGGLFVGAENEYLEHNIIPVLNSPDDLERWRKLAKQKNITLRAMLHLDTGMNRLGFSLKETDQIIHDPQSFDGINLDTILSHFACADEANHPLTARQADDFSGRIKLLSRLFPKALKSLANSSGLFCDPAYHYDLVRPGYALYGGNPVPHAANPMKPVVSLSARILQVRQCQKGESIGYAASHIFERESVTATIALGYADGFLRSNSGRAQVYYNGLACPVTGRVSMDLVTVDITHLPHKPVQGDWLEILGANQTVDDLAATAGTIGYEILTSLGARYKRDYTGSYAAAAA